MSDYAKTYAILVVALIIAILAFIREVITAPKELRLGGCISSGVAVLIFYMVVNYIASR